MRLARALVRLALIPLALAFTGWNHQAEADGLLRRMLRGDADAPATAQLPAGLQLVELPHSGMQRTFYLHVPPGHDGGRSGAVLVFHGGMGNGARVAAQTGMAGLADQRGFVAVFPDGIDGHWDDGRATTASAADDVGFVLAIIDYLARQWNVDPGRVFATGASNGGMLTLRLACDAADRFAAFASVIANLPADYLPRCRPSRPVALMMINGTEDRLMKWDGGTIPGGRVPGRGKGGDVISTPETVRFWLDANGCQGDGETSSLPDRFDDDTRVVRHGYTSCRPGGEVIMFEIQGGGHGWPGSPVKTRRRFARIIGAVSQDLDASLAIVDFFSRHGL